jgi:hypothetical protein
LASECGYSATIAGAPGGKIGSCVRFAAPVAASFQSERFVSERELNAGEMDDEPVSSLDAGR